MKYKAITKFTLVFATVAMFFNCHHTSSSSVRAAPDTNVVSGEWDAQLEAFGTLTAVKMNLKLDGGKVTGTVESGHTGVGIISDGWWKNDKLGFTAKFEKHESVAFTGEMRDGKLKGEYATEGRVSKWAASRKKAVQEASRSDNKTPDVADIISGEWNAALFAQGTTVPMALKLKLDGDRLTGTAESEHLGTGPVNNGTWKDGKATFTFDSNGATITFTGTVKDNKLSGEFSAGKMTGTWEGARK